MAIDSAGKFRARIIEMHTAEIFKANNTLEISKYFLAAIRAAHIVTGSKGVAGVIADANTGFIFDTVDHRCQLFKAKAQITALTGGIFDHCGNPSSGIQSQINRLTDGLNALVLGDFAQVTAGMKVEVLKTQLLTAL